MPQWIRIMNIHIRTLTVNERLYKSATGHTRATQDGYEANSTISLMQATYSRLARIKGDSTRWANHILERTGDR
jgi:hypothetical protein